MTTNADIVRSAFDAFQAREWEAFESLLADEFVFSSPHDPHLDKDGYYERCWPNMGHMRSQKLDRVVEAGDEVFVRYEVVKRTGERFRNTELFAIRGGKIARVEVYYGAEFDG